MRLKDPFSSISHLVGAVASVVGLVFLVYKAATVGTVWHIVAFSIFGASLILLYSASAVYHAVNAAKRVTRVLRKLDHSMIYVLIAGTYTPMCLIALRGIWGWSLLVGIWILAVTGIILKIVWLDAPRWVSTMAYALMGWLVVAASAPLVRALTPSGMIWLAVGGLCYTIGAVIYGTKWPRIKSKVFGFHEIFHLFVLGGSLAHYWMMFRYVLPIG